MAKLQLLFIAQFLYGALHLFVSASHNVAMRFWSIWPKVNASWFLWYVPIHHGYWGWWW